MLQDLGGATDLLKMAAVQNGDVRGHVERLRLIVRHHHEGQFGSTVDFANFLQQLGAQMNVEGAKGLVEHDQFRLDDQGPRQGDALLLAAAQVPHVPAFVSGQIHHLQRFGDAASALFPGNPAHGQTETDVRPDVHVRKQREGLPHHHHAMVAGRHRRQILAAEHQAAARGRNDACHHFENRGLAAAARPDDGQKLAFPENKREVGDRDRVAVGSRYVLHFENRRRCCVDIALGYARPSSPGAAFKSTPSLKAIASGPPVVARLASCCKSVVTPLPDSPGPPNEAPPCASVEGWTSPTTPRTVRPLGKECAPAPLSRQTIIENADPSTRSMRDRNKETLEGAGRFRYTGLRSCLRCLSFHGACSAFPDRLFAASRERPGAGCDSDTAFDGAEHGSPGATAPTLRSGDEIMIDTTRRERKDRHSP